MGRRVAGEAELLNALADDFVQQRGRDPVASKAAGREVIAIGNELAHGVGDRHHFIDKPLGFRAKRLSCRFHIRAGE